MNNVHLVYIMKKLKTKKIIYVQVVIQVMHFMKSNAKNVKKDANCANMMKKEIICAQNVLMAML